MIIKKKPMTIALYLILLAVLLAFLGSVITRANTPQALQSKACLLNEAKTCFADLGEYGRAELTVLSRPLTTMKPMTVQLVLHSDRIKNATGQIQVSGKNMFMGLQKAPLKLVGEQTFQASFTLASCAMETMLWQMKVLLHTESQSHQLLYFFETHRESPNK